ncbi:MAG: glycosyltransferase family 2 protein [Dehalococcoidia bacterium]|nr:glycosyltransferase family 2 protein [Dehalococcoidia bacterium]
MSAPPRQRRSDVLVIVPVHNEAETLGDVLAELREHAPAYDVVVVNDGSTDATEAVARAAGYHVLDLCLNLGIGGAVQAGFKYALERGYAIAVQMDGDGQHRPDEIDALVAPVRAGSCEMCIGSRFLDDVDYDGSVWRRLGTRFLSRVCALVTGLHITDATSGFRAFGPNALRYLASYYPADYPEPEAIVLLSRRGLPIREVPVRMRPRLAGQSSISGIQTVYYMAKVSLSLLLAVFKEGSARQAA